MGVLAVQAGRADQAIGFLERAVAASPGDAAYQHNLGQAYLSAGRAGEAVSAFERAAKLVPDRADTLLAWGLAHLSRGAPGDAQAAVFALKQANLAGADSPELHRHSGLAHLAANQADDAVAAFEAALLAMPDDPATLHHHLALAHRHRGDVKAARRHLNKALEIEPRLARAWYALATLDAEAGNAEIAVGLYRKAIKADATHAAAHSGLGRALDALGRRAEAMAAYAAAVSATRRASAAAARVAAPLPAAVASLERKLTDPKAVERHHVLAANTNVFSPTTVPANSVAALFDRYAKNFDDHLRGTLRYGVPELIAEAVARAAAPTAPDAAAPADADAPQAPVSLAYADVLDLGCGTGLCGPPLRPLAHRLCGVDLSPNMIDKARERGVYDQLEVGELVDTLRRVPAGSFDALTAADVFNYVGDLGPALEAAAVALRPGGVLAFTVEAGGGERYHLHQKTLRFTHAEAYVRRVAAIHGFEEAAFDAVALRTQRDVPVTGYLVVLRKPMSSEARS
jgi:predicted TPR repeat methyltransferase